METDPIVITATDLSYVQNFLDSAVDIYRAYDQQT
jgi:hypothetical protein